MITIIFGKPGVGKTALNTYFAIQNMMDRRRYFNCVNDINGMNAEGYNFSLPPLPHTVFSNYTIFNRSRYCSGIFTYLFNPYKFSLPNDDIEFELLPPYSSYHITEGQTVLNSRKSKNFRSCVSGAYENHRHIDLDIFIDMQRPKLADVNIRELVSNFIAVLALTHKTDSMGRIISSTWYTLEFDDWSLVEKYLSTKDENLGVAKTYTFEGNIFICYNSKCNKCKFYQMGYNKDFKYILSSESDKISLVAPSNFYEKGA